MPWPPKQRVAIFLDTKRRHGLKAAKKVMHEAGYGPDAKKAAKVRKHGRTRKAH
jgi:hypothetical protein